MARRSVPLAAAVAVATVVALGAVTARPAGAATNLALNRPATGSASCNGDEVPAKAVNGSVTGGNSDKWCSQVDGTKVLSVDLGTNRTVGGVVVRHASAGGEATEWNTRDFAVQVSTNGTTFTTVASTAGNTDGVTRHAFTQQPARYVRLGITTPTSDGDAAARVYEFEVYETAPPGEEPPPGDCHADAPPTVTDYISDHRVTMTRVACNADVAVYFDDALRALPSAGTAWVAPFITDVFRHHKATYGSCAVARDLPAPIGPNCVRYGEPKPLMAFFHQGRFFGGTVANRFDGFSGFRNTIDAGDDGWREDNGTLHDVITHESCHIVEGASQGVHESPAFEVWGDSKWAEFCVYDYYASTGRTADAQRAYNEFIANRDDMPDGARSAAWFRDWFYPLWEESGRNGAVMQRFFELLSRYFPKEPENGGRNLIYSRRMNAGEFVHFVSGAAGRDLSGRAAQAFNSGFSRAQFEQARRDFPAITY